MDDKSAGKVYGLESPRKFHRPDPFEIAVTNPRRREDVLHMDDAAGLASIIRLKPLKSRPEEKGGARGEVMGSVFAVLGMHKWINLNSNENTVPDGPAARFPPGLRSSGDREKSS